VEARLGGGTGGHNGLKSLRDGLGSPEFRRVRVGVGRPETTDPEVVSKWVLSRFRESDSEVAELVDDAARAVERVVVSEEQPQ
jgi:PTH1 family peptidyl-tRNA hydrolase